MKYYAVRIIVPPHLEPYHPKIQVNRSDISQTHLYISFGIAPSTSDVLPSEPEHPSVGDHTEYNKPSIDVVEAIYFEDVAQHPVASIELTLPWKSLRCDLPGGEKALSNQHANTLNDMPDGSLLLYPTPPPTDRDTPPPLCCPPESTTTRLASSLANADTPSSLHSLPEHTTPRLPHSPTDEDKPPPSPIPPHHQPGSTTPRFTNRLPGSTTLRPTLPPTDGDTTPPQQNPPATTRLHPRLPPDEGQTPPDRALLNPASPSFQKETPAPQIAWNTEDAVALGQHASTKPVSSKVRGLRNPTKRTLQSSTETPQKRRCDVGKRIAESFSSAIRAGGRIYEENKSAFDTWEADLRLLEPDRSKATFLSFFTAQATYADALQCRGVVASMIYSWCLITVEYFAASSEYNTSSEYSKFMMGPVSKQDRRKAKLGMLILQIIKRLALIPEIGSHAYKICSAIVYAVQSHESSLLASSVYHDMSNLRLGVVAELITQDLVGHPDQAWMMIGQDFALDPASHITTLDLSYNDARKALGLEGIPMLEFPSTTKPSDCAQANCIDEEPKDSLHEGAIAATLHPRDMMDNEHLPGSLATDSNSERNFFSVDIERMEKWDEFIIYSPLPDNGSTE